MTSTKVYKHKLIENGTEFLLTPLTNEFYNIQKLRNAIRYIEYLYKYLEY